MAKRDFSDIPYLFVGVVVAVQEEIERAADKLVDKGKSLTPEGRKKAMSAKKGLVSKGDEFSQVVGRTVQRVLENSGLATRSDLEILDGRAEEIEEMVVASSRARKKAAGKPARKKPARKKAAKKPATAKDATEAKKPVEKPKEDQ
ncbi:MAG: hypothetical protein KKB90_05900 [Actinobacteria bacterium]|nr:hypothetical protein [Actinomycetota bacterium]MCG2818034.1 hypothetical protein [Actinomycetes bacterium]MBU4218480.1 hypothetical protein [Actinomycetota bacterium]MBU4358240.1 hypothetical protein [Actinomycetota bacterium]MBU4391382.1 hypothetical protein [Actinomycetota bacterium]